MGGLILGNLLQNFIKDETLWQRLGAVRLGGPQLSESIMGCRKHPTTNMDQTPMAP